MFAREASKALELHGGLTGSDLEILLKHLARDKALVVYDDEVNIIGLWFGTANIY